MRADRPGAVVAAAALTPLEQAALSAANARQAGTSREQLRRLGVVHTPSVLVRFALARVAHALRTDLGLPDGLASAEVELVDPAVGTGTWLSTLFSSLLSAPGSGSGPRRAPGRILGLDADAAALATARGVLAPAAEGLATELVLRHENTLALPDVWSSAGRVRVIVGNPPWAARSRSRGVALSDAWLREFYSDPDGAPLNERRSGVLSDDYVRFFRWALQQAREAPRGALVCLVTNASYLDGPVHRGMRGALVRAFDRIEIVDLGGNTLRSRAGTADEALFPVRVGAALALCVRGARAGAGASVAFSALRGSRGAKQEALARAALPATQIVACAPGYAFRPRTGAVRAPLLGFALHEAFLFHAEGVQTNRDELATAPDADQLLDRLVRIARGELPLRGSAHFSPALVRARLEQALAGPQAALIGRLAYRPFESRAYCKLAPLCHRPRPRLAEAVARSPLCLLSTRKEPGAADWNMFALIEGLADSSYLSTRSSCRTRVFPSHGPDGASNLAPHVYERIAQRVGSFPRSEDVVAYAAGMLGAPAFRREHQAALAHDYARIPWPSDAAMFAAGVAAGRRFASLLAGGEAPPALDRSDERSAALFVRGTTRSEAQVPRRALRWLAPHLLEVGEGTQIGARNERCFQARVGHQPIVESVYRGCASATIAVLLEASARALRWVEAEQAADRAYRPAGCVGSDANAIADLD